MIQLTEAAADAIHSAIANVPKSIVGMRLSVQGSCCEGFQYEMGLVEQEKSVEFSCESRGVRILMDICSVALLSGTTIDYVNNQNGIGFSFDNPQARSKGGCGKSCC